MAEISREIVAFIPVRGGSKSIPLKNIASIGGKPLVYWVAKACSDSAYLSETFISSDSHKIRECVMRMGLQRLRVIERSPETATDEATTEAALLEFASRYDFAHVALVQATSPLLTSGDIDKAIETYFSSGADSLLSVVRTKRFLWKEKNGFVQPLNYNPLQRPRRQEWAGQLVENGALYMASKERLLRSGCRLWGRIAAYEMAPETYVELDEPHDWLMIDALLREKTRKAAKCTMRAQGLKLFCVDVDGTLTDGGMYYTPEGEVMKRFNTRDAMGMELLRKQGVMLAIISAENSPIVLSRAKKLNIDEVHIGIKDKEAFIETLLDRLGVKWEELGYVGDDLNDLGVIRRAGFSACPCDASPPVVASSIYVCQKAGGYGAVREACEVILTAMSPLRG